MLISLITLVVLGIVAFVGVRNSKDDGCLKEYEVATYSIPDVYARPGSITVTVNDTRGIALPRKIDLVILNANHYHPIELHRCHFYLAQSKGYDYEKEKALLGYEAFINTYNYKGDKDSSILIDEESKIEGQKYANYFKNDFRVSPTEDYITLIRGYIGRDDFALVIRNLHTNEDVFVLSLSEIAKDNQDRVGSFNLHGWTEDGRYFWSGTYEGAYVMSYIRIDTTNWSYEIFDAPDGAMGGSPLNVESGWVPINPGGQWTGADIFDAMLTKQLLQEGYVNRLYLYNLFTKEQIFLTETAADPLFWFEPEWISDTKLQYVTADGEVKIYEIK